MEAAAAAGAGVALGKMASSELDSMLRGTGFLVALSRASLLILLVFNFSIPVFCFCECIYV